MAMRWWIGFALIGCSRSEQRSPARSPDQLIEEGLGLIARERTTTVRGELTYDPGFTAAVQYKVTENDETICDADIAWVGGGTPWGNDPSWICGDCTYAFGVASMGVEDRSLSYCNYDTVWTGISTDRQSMAGFFLTQGEEPDEGAIGVIVEYSDGGVPYSYYSDYATILASSDGEGLGTLVTFGDGAASWTYLSTVTSRVPDWYHPCGEYIWVTDFEGYGDYPTDEYAAADELGCGGSGSDRWAVTLQRDDTMSVQVWTASDPDLLPAFRVNRPDGCTLQDPYQAEHGFEHLDWDPWTEGYIVADMDGIWTINVVDVGDGCASGSAADYGIRAHVERGAFAE